MMTTTKIRDFVQGDAIKEKIIINSSHDYPTTRVSLRSPLVLG